MEFELEAKKSLGQNFLKNTTIIKKMVAACLDSVDTYIQHNPHIHKKDITVLEIGPGTGALTSYILETGLKTKAVEADIRAIPLLQDKFSSYIEQGQFTLIHKDVREYDPQTIQQPYIIVANIPYYLTGYIMRMFLESKNQPITMICMVQKEVAIRALDTKNSLASLGVKTYGKPRILTHVSKGNFVPAPKVDSSVLIIEDIHQPFGSEKEESTYWGIAKKAFGNKRKQLGKTLETLTDTKTLELYGKKRPEELSVSDWLYIVHNIYRKM